MDPPGVHLRPPLPLERGEAPEALVEDALVEPLGPGALGAAEQHVVVALVGGGGGGGALHHVVVDWGVTRFKCLNLKPIFYRFNILVSELTDGRESLYSVH